MSEQVERKSAVLRLRGLPFQSGEDEIRQFLTGFGVDSVYVCKKNNRPNGEAFVTFTSPTEASNAKQAKDKESLGNRYIEIFDVREDEMPPVKDDDDKNKGHVLRLRGLPYSATLDQIRAFFQDIELSKDKNAIVISLSTGDRKPQGEAYVDFASEEDYREGLKRNKQKMGERYIELFPSSRGDLKQQLVSQQGGRGRGEQGQGPYVRGGGRGRVIAAPVPLPAFPPTLPGVPPITGPQASTDGSTLKLRGLPFSTNIADVISFFEGFNLQDSNVSLVPKHDRSKTVPQCSGIAFVQFDSPETARKAKDAKDKKRMGTRYVECMHYMAPRHLQPQMMHTAYGPAGGTPPFALPPPLAPHPGGRGMHAPPGGYGPRGGPHHMQPYGQPPPPPHGEVMPPGPVHAMGRAPGGRQPQGNGGRGRGGQHQHYQGNAAPHLPVDYSQQGFQQGHAYYQQPGQHQQAFQH